MNVVTFRPVYADRHDGPVRVQVATSDGRVFFDATRANLETALLAAAVRSGHEFIVRFAPALYAGSNGELYTKGSSILPF